MITAYGPGSISLRLDERLKDEIVRDAFLSVLRDVRTKLESFGEWVRTNRSSTNDIKFAVNIYVGLN